MSDFEVMMFPPNSPLVLLYASHPQPSYPLPCQSHLHPEAEPLRVTSEAPDFTHLVPGAPAAWHSSFPTRPSHSVGDGRVQVRGQLRRGVKVAMQSLSCFQIFSPNSILTVSKVVELHSGMRAGAHLPGWS